MSEANAGSSELASDGARTSNSYRERSERTKEPSTEREQGGEAALLEATEGVTQCPRERSERRLVRASL